MRQVQKPSKRSKFGNNCAAELLESRTLLAADLVASLSYTAGTYHPGQNITVAMLNEINVGDMAAGEFRTQLFLSTDSVLGDGDIPLADIARSGDPLAPGALSRNAQTLTIGAAMAAGRYFVIVKVDSGNAIAEGVETNNVWVSTAADIVIAKPTVSIVAIDKTAAEARGRNGAINTGRFRVSRTGPTDFPLSVDYSTGGTAATNDFAALSGTVTIPAGSASATITLVPTDDSSVEGTERVVLSLVAADAYTVATGASASARVDINDNDGSRVSVVATDATAAEQGESTATFTFSRAGAGSAGDLTVNYTVGGLATPGTDYVTLSGSIIIYDGSTTATVTLTPIDDSRGELAETVLLTLSPSASYLIVASRRIARASIADNEPVVKIAATDASATEQAAGTASFLVTRTGSMTGELVVLYSVSGEAVAGTDYIALTGSVTIAAGAPTARITLTPIDDSISERPESVVLLLSDGAGYRVDPATSRKRATAMIADNEPLVSIVASDATATETGATSATFTVTRSGTPTGALTVSYTLGGSATAGSDYDAIPTTIIIPDAAASATITITAINDSIGEGSETVVITLIVPEGAAYNRVVTRSTARATITDNEPSVSIIATDSAAAETVTGDPNNATFTVTRTGLTAGALTIPYTISGTATPSGGADPADYTAVSGSVVIPDGQSSATIAINVLDDAAAEIGETVIITLGGNVGYLLSTSRKIATATIADNEPVVTIAATDGTATEADVPAPTTPPANPAPNRVATFTISLAAIWTSDVTVSYTIGGTALNTTDYDTIAATATIVAGQTTATIVITPTQDAFGEGDETVEITLAAAPAYNLITTADRHKARATIKDDEPIVSIVATDNSATETDQTSATLTLTRTGATSAELTVSYLVAGTAEQDEDYEALDGEVTFAIGSATATITITAIDDRFGEGAETVIVSLEGGGAGGGNIADAEYAVDAAKASVTANISDNEAVVSIVATDAAAAENNNPGTFTFRRTGDTSEALIVPYSISGIALLGTDFTSADMIGSITIEAGQSTATLTITPIYDLLTEVPETVILTLTPPDDSGDGAGYKLDTAKVATVTIANAPAIDLALADVGAVGRTLSLASTGILAPITASISNLGDALSTASSIEFRFSTNSVWGDSDDIVIGTSSFGTLAGGGGITVAFTFAFDTIKARLAAGSYHLGARIDAGARLTEAGRGNNQWFSAAADWVVTA